MHALAAQLFIMVAAVIAGVLVAEMIEAPVRTWAGRLAAGLRR